jgi:hypothetical protein
MQMEMQQNDHLSLTTLIKRVLDIPIVNIHLLVLVRLIPKPIQMRLQSPISFTSG